MLSAVVGFWVGSAATAQQPAKLPSTAKAAAKAPSQAATGNQKLADKVAAKLAGTKVAYDADLSLETQDGVLTITGTCRTASQKQEILSEVRVVEGVTMVRDGLKVEAPRIQQAQAGGGPRISPVPSGMPPMGLPPGGLDPAIDPLPLGPAGGGADMQAPGMPGYAWPTYAPYNNLSRVAYPTAYPYNAFPFIGPFYPFPKVPLGWRKVTLEWEDGHWWLGRKQAPIDYWRVRFW
jgi:hypothetical protein